MAGIALAGDLNDLLTGTAPVEIRHRLEADVSACPFTDPVTATLSFFYSQSVLGDKRNHWNGSWAWLAFKLCKPYFCSRLGLDTDYVLDMKKHFSPSIGLNKTKGPRRIPNYSTRFTHR